MRLLVVGIFIFGLCGSAAAADEDFASALRRMAPDLAAKLVDKKVDKKSEKKKPKKFKIKLPGKGVKHPLKTKSQPKLARERMQWLRAMGGAAQQRR